MPQIYKYGETKTTRIMMATVRHVTAWAGRKKYQTAWFLLNRMYPIYTCGREARVGYPCFTIRPTRAAVRIPSLIRSKFSKYIYESEQYWVYSHTKKKETFHVQCAFLVNVTVFWDNEPRTSPCPKTGPPCVLL